MELARNLRKLNEDTWAILSLQNSNDVAPYEDEIKEYTKFETWKLITSTKYKIAMSLFSCYKELELNQIHQDPSYIYLLNYPFQFDSQIVFSAIEEKRFQLTNAEDLKDFYNEQIAEWTAILNLERQFQEDTNNYRLFD